MRDLFIVGAGGFGREAIWTVERINALSQQPQWNIIGYADDDPKWKKGDNFEGFPILGTIEEASRDYPGASVFIAVGKNSKRADIAKRLRGHDFPAIIDPKAQISPTTDFLEGAFIAAGAVVQVGAELGRFVIVGIADDVPLRLLRKRVDALDSPDCLATEAARSYNKKVSHGTSPCCA